MEITPEIQALLDAQKETLKAGFEAEVVGLKKNVEDWRAEKEAAKQAALIAKQEKEAADLAAAKASGDIKSVSESLEAKLAEKDAKIKEYENSVAQSKLEAVAGKFISQYGEGAAFVLDAMANEFKKRLDVRDGEVKVLDPNGNLTANTIEDLTKEFCISERYANCIKGTQATGGGATGSKSTGGARKQPKDMTSLERLAFKQADPAGFKKAFNL